MRELNVFNVTVVVMSIFLTWKTVSAEPMKVHVIENLSAQESKEIKAELTKIGYRPSQKELFSESKNAILITKAIATEHEKASLSFELVRLENENELPHTLFQYKLDGNDLHALMKAFPGPSAFTPSQFKPMALQTN